MRISDFWTAVYLPAHPALSNGSVRQYEISIQHWATFFGPDLPDHLTVADFGLFARHLLESGHRTATVNKIRRHVLAILHFAREMELIDSMPKWRALSEPRRAPVAFLVTEFEAGLAIARAWPGWICGVPAGPWWESLLLAIWYSGARIGAVLAVEQSDVDLATATFFVRAAHQKQRTDQAFRIGPDCVRALREAWGPDRRLQWPWPHRRETLYRAFRKIFALAGVNLGNNTGSLFHRIRKSTASYLAAGGGNATSQLGHSSTSVTARYLDPRICGTHDATAMMPRLG